MESANNLNFPLIKFSENPIDWWYLRDAVEGVQIFGGIGSGKTSGSGKMLANSFLNSGYGGIIHCAKPDEAKQWLEYAKKTGREKDIILFQEGSDWRFNPLQYELSRKGRGGGQTMNIVELLMTLFKMGQRITGSGEENGEKFWETAMKRCATRIIDLLRLAKEEVSVMNMTRILSDSPMDLSMNELLSRVDFTNDDIIELSQTNFCVKCLYNAGEIDKNPQQERDYLLVSNYFLKDFASLDVKIQSTIKEMFYGVCEPFYSGILNDHFASDTNLYPEDTFDGKIILLDFPVKDYLVAGIYAQSIFKYIWQQSVERRDVNSETLPVFLWVDESQYFVNEYDTIFQTTARSSRACTVFLTQNISNYYAQMGGKQIVAKVNSLLGNLSTKIFHCNNDPVTNELAAKIIGYNLMAVESGGNSRNTFSIENNTSESFSMQLLPQVLPVEFTQLKTGGEINNNEVQAIISAKGHTWSNGKNYKKVIFKQ